MTQAKALEILKSGANAFVTGEPGAGKSYTVNAYVAFLRAHGVDVAITASTGIAATHIGGMTIHSWSGLGIRDELTRQDINRLAALEYLAKRMRKARVLIIDEVSMLAPKTLDLVHRICQGVRESSEPFGGLQIIFVGDFFQLPPIVRREAPDAQLTLVAEDEARFAYESSAWREADPTVCYLTEQHRQDDKRFHGLLSSLRENAITDQHVQTLVGRRIAAKRIPERAPKLYTHNIDVDRVNAAALARLRTEGRTYAMVADGKDGVVAGLKKGCLSPESLELKIGAEVMFTKNNAKEHVANGTLGTVTGFDPDTQFPVVQTRSGACITAVPATWTIEEGTKVIGQISQVPLRLAWAITVHKSQGMSLDEAVMDLRQVFEFGQGYVALSRVRRLSGLHILGWNDRALKVHPDILVQDEKFRAASERAELRTHAPALAAKSLTSIEQIRKTQPKAYARWTKTEDEALRGYAQQRLPIARLATLFQRKPGAIRSRLRKLGIDS